LSKRDQRPIHLALREVAAQITRDPELSAFQADVAVMTMIDLVGIVELAVMLGLSMIVVCGRMSVEVADAEVRTATGFESR